MTAVRRLAANLLVMVGQSAWVVFGFVLAASLAVWLFAGWVSTNSGKLEVLLTVNAIGYFLAVVLVVGGAALVTREKQASTKKLLALRWAKWTKYPKILWLFPLYLLVSVLVHAAVAWLFADQIDLNQKQDLGFTAASLVSPYQYVVAFIMLVILPPIFEEILFRGYLYGRIRKRMGFWVTAVATSAVFGFVHLNWSVSIDVFVLSMFLCYLREDSHSLAPAMLMHSLKNGLAYFLLFIAPLLGIQLVQ